MNETLKVLESRRSCRNFDREKMVSEEDLNAIIKAGTQHHQRMNQLHEKRIMCII